MKNTRLPISRPSAANVAEATRQVSGGVPTPTQAANTHRLNTTNSSDVHGSEISQVLEDFPADGLDQWNVRRLAQLRRKADQQLETLRGLNGT